METKKYTTHSSFWWKTASFILWAIALLLLIIWKPTHSFLIVSFSVFLVFDLIEMIQHGLAWHSYMEISDEGVKMKGCAKRVSEDKKEKVNDIFIPWKEIDEIKGWLGYPELVLKTGEKITLTQPINVDRQTVQKAFEQYKSIQRQKEQEQLRNEAEQLKDKIISVISETDNNEV
jgi:hypothetical protein